VSEHGIGRLMHRSPPGSDLVVRLLLSGQPLRGEEPGLVGRDGHEAADGDRPVIMQGELNLIPLADVQRGASLIPSRKMTVFTPGWDRASRSNRDKALTPKRVESLRTRLPLMPSSTTPGARSPVAASRLRAR
jgi:hypothetical protein